MHTNEYTPYQQRNGYSYTQIDKPSLNKVHAGKSVRSLLERHNLDGNYEKMDTLGQELLENLHETRFNYKITWNLSTKQWLSLMVHCIVKAASFNKCVYNRQKLFDIADNGLKYGRLTPKQATMVAQIIMSKEVPLKDTSKFSVRAVPTHCLPLPTTDHVTALALANGVGEGLDEDSDELYELHEPYWDSAIEAFNSTYNPTYKN